MSLLHWLKPREALGKKVGLSRQTQPPRTGLSPREMSLSCLQAVLSLIPLCVGSSKCIVSTNLRAAVFRGARGKGRGQGSAQPCLLALGLGWGKDRSHRVKRAHQLLCHPQALDDVNKGIIEELKKTNYREILKDKTEKGEFWGPKTATSERSLCFPSGSIRHAFLPFLRSGAWHCSPSILISVPPPTPAFLGTGEGDLGLGSEPMLSALFLQYSRISLINSSTTC